MLARFRQLSVSAKIISLVTTTVAGSVAAQVYFGSALIVADKTSYIYSSQLALLASFESEWNNRVNGSVALGDLLLRADIDGTRAFSAETLRAFYSSYADRFALGRVSVYESNGFAPPSLTSEFGPKGAFDKFPSSLEWLKPPGPQNQLTIGPETGGVIPLFRQIGLGNGKARGYLVEIPFGSAFFRNTPANQKVFFLNQRGALLLSNGPRQPGLSAEQTSDLLSVFADGPVSAGVKTWRISGEEIILSYRKISSSPVVIIAITPRSQALAAANPLLWRSVVVGLSILLVALGMSALLIWSLASKLRELVGATEKIAGGDFSLNLPVSSRDEFGMLARSFNLLSRKIGVLISETAKKARMEKELETAQLLQNGFFPKPKFTNDAISIGGNYKPSSECAGDWWDYKIRENKLYLVVGDVAGHGVSTALVTAAAHAVFHQFLEDPMNEAAQKSLEPLMKRLNRTIFNISAGNTTMTMAACQIDLQSGEMLIVNASHVIPYLGRRSDASAALQFSPLLITPSAALGYSRELDVEEKKVQLDPGDTLFLYSDGFFEPRPVDRKKISKKTLLQLASKALSDNPEEPAEACASLIRAAVSFHGLENGSLSDDVTAVLAKFEGGLQK